MTQHTDLLQELNIALAQIEEWRDESLSMGVPNAQILENSDKVEVMLNAIIAKAPKQEAAITKLLEALKVLVYHYEGFEDSEISSIQKQIFVDDARAVIAEVEK